MMVLALKSGIIFIRTRPEPLPRLSTATRTSAARRPLSYGRGESGRINPQRESIRPSERKPTVAIPADSVGICVNLIRGGSQILPSRES